jgi:hypothetical protein
MVEGPKHDEVRVAFNVREALLKGGQDIQRALCLVPGAKPLGISFVFLNGLLTNPIGCGVNIDARRLCIHTKRTGAENREQ